MIFKNKSLKVQALRSPSKVHVLKKKSKKNQRSPSSVPSRKFQGGPSSVPKQRQYVRKHFKGVPQRCLNKKKVQKKFQSRPSSVPKQKKMRVKKRFKSCFIPYFKVWSSVSRFHPLYGDFRDIWKPRMKQRKGMRQGMGRGSTFQITLLQWNIFVFLFFGTLPWFSSPVGPSNLRLKNQTQLGLQTQEELKMISYIWKRKNFWKFWNLTEIEGPFQFKWGSSMGTRIMLWGPPTRTYTKSPCLTNTPMQELITVGKS